jgi:hypothetical protein
MYFEFPIVQPSEQFSEVKLLYANTCLPKEWIALGQIQKQRRTRTTNITEDEKYTVGLWHLKPFLDF